MLELLHTPNADYSVEQVVAPIICTCLCLQSTSSSDLGTNHDALKSVEVESLQVGP